MYTTLQNAADATLQGRLKRGVRVVSVNIQQPVSGIDTNVHLHPNMLHIGYCESGSGFIYCEDEVHRFRPGFIYMLYPGIAHRFRATRKTPYKAFFVHVEVSGAVIRELPEVIPLGHSQRRIEQLIRRMRRDHVGSRLETRDLRLVGLFAQLYAELIDMVSHASDGDSSPRRKATLPQHQTPAEALKRMLDRFQTPPFRFPGIDALAEQAAMSRRSFTKLFRGMIGCAPYELFNRLRLQHAHELIASGELTVKEVASCCGYSTSQSFIRAYKSHFGDPPRRHCKRRR